MQRRWLWGIGMAAALGLVPAAGLADPVKAGGKAPEHRSERAQERSNAQWSEGATKGQEHAEQRRHEAEEEAAAGQESAGKKKPGKEKVGKRDGSEDAGAEAE